MNFKEFIKNYAKYSEIEINEELQKEINDFLQAKLKTKRWRPTTNQKFYFVDDEGNIKEDKWSGSLYNQTHWELDNCFKEIEEAKFRLEQMKVYNKLKFFAIENNDKIAWGDNSYKFSIQYDFEEEELEIGWHCFCLSSGEIYFSSSELAQEAIDYIGEGVIKKYLFGVEDE